MPLAYGSSWLGFKSELQLLAYTRAMRDLSHICDLGCQCQVLNLRSKAKDQTQSQGYCVGVLTCWATMRTPNLIVLTATNLTFCQIDSNFPFLCGGVLGFFSNQGGFGGGGGWLLSFLRAQHDHSPKYQQGEVLITHCYSLHRYSQ